MSGGNSIVPVVLFAFKRQDKLIRTLECLKRDQVPLIIVYSDGPRRTADTEAVAQVRCLLRQVDWCHIEIRENQCNLGLGTSIKTGVGNVLKQYGRAVIFEDDIECAPGMYRYMCRMLDAFSQDARVMSVSGYTHPLLLPPEHPRHPYCDGRFVCWGWATWRRAWVGMQIPAVVLVIACLLRGVNPFRYGRDIVTAAFDEKKRSLWAARFELLHILRRGLTVHPPISLTNHMGFDDSTTSMGGIDPWQIGVFWGHGVTDETVPMPHEAEHVQEVYEAVYGGIPGLGEVFNKARSYVWRFRSRCAKMRWFNPQ